MRKPSLLLTLLPLLASACAAGPAYVPPQSPPAAAGPFISHAAGIDAARDLPADWWRLYRDPALDDLIAQAFAANTDLRVASANLAKARAVMQEARAGRLPGTDVSGGVGYGNSVQSGLSGGSDPQWSYSGDFGLSWEADLFGRIGRAVEAASADAEAVEAARDAVRVTVAAETTRAYLDACASAHGLSVAEQSLQVSTESLRLVTMQEQAGSASRLDIERAAAAEASARAALPTFEGQRQVARFELAALLGTTPDKVPEAALGCVMPPEPAASIPVGDGAALLRRRPDLREAEHRLAADTARIGVATAELYPSISLGGSGSFLRNDQVRGSDSFSFSLGPLLSWRFPNVSVARARLRQAEAQGDASLATFDGKVVTALKEVEQALTLVDTEQRRLVALSEAQERSQRAYALADRRYRAGSIGWLESDLLATRAAYAASLRQLSLARVDLFKALGGGWQDAVAAERAIQ